MNGVNGNGSNGSRRQVLSSGLFDYDKHDLAILKTVANRLTGESDVLALINRLGAQNEVELCAKFHCDSLLDWLFEGGTGNFFDNVEQLADVLHPNVVGFR